MHLNMASGFPDVPEGAETMTITTPSMGTTSPKAGPIEAALRAILAEVTPGQRPYSSDSYLPSHLIRAAQSALPTPPGKTTMGRMLHQRLAAPTWTTPIDPSARQAAIENALSMALWHVRRADTAQALHVATGRTIRAAAMLKQACTEATNGGRA
jgi:hypothetical protein